MKLTKSTCSTTFGLEYRYDAVIEGRHLCAAVVATYGELRAAHIDLHQALDHRARRMLADLIVDELFKSQETAT